MTRILDLEEIKRRLAYCDPELLIACMERAFVAYSQSRAVVPEAGYLKFDKPPGDVHIKYGYLYDEDTYLVKVASSFYNNPLLQFPSSNGVMLVFSQKTGALQTILLDEGYLTDLRTALAGAVIAKYLAPQKVEAIGIIGTGTQARLQLLYLKYVVKCKQVYVYGRSQENLQLYADEMIREGFNVVTAKNIDEIVDNCNYIVTTTPSYRPILKSVKRGTHITAVGADAPGKQELGVTILQKAELIVVDSYSQCMSSGELQHIIKPGLAVSGKVIELGQLIAMKLSRSNNGTTVADLTGVAVQDMAIAAFVSGLASDTRDL